METPPPKYLSSQVSEKAALAARKRKLNIPLPLAPPPRRPWLSSLPITHLLTIARAQCLIPPSTTLPPSILDSLQQEWEHIVHDTFENFKSKMQCLECGHLIDWCGDEGVAWFLDDLRREMDTCDVEDVDERQVDKWDKGLEKMVPVLEGRRSGGCWLLGQDEDQEQEKEDGEDSVVIGEVGEVCGDWEGNGKVDVGVGGVLEEFESEGLEALHLMGGEGFTADGFVRHKSPLWGSVIDESLDDDYMGEGHFIEEQLDRNPIVGEYEGNFYSQELLSEEAEFAIPEDAEDGQNRASSDTVDVKQPEAAEAGNLIQFFVDTLDAASDSSVNGDPEWNDDGPRQIEADDGPGFFDEKVDTDTDSQDDYHALVASGAFEEFLADDGTEVDDVSELNSGFEEEEKDGEDEDEKEESDADENNPSPYIKPEPESVFETQQNVHTKGGLEVIEISSDSSSSSGDSDFEDSESEGQTISPEVETMEIDHLNNSISEGQESKEEDADFDHAPDHQLTYFSDVSEVVDRGAEVKGHDEEDYDSEKSSDVEWGDGIEVLEDTDGDADDEGSELTLEGAGSNFDSDSDVMINQKANALDSAPESVGSDGEIYDHETYQEVRSENGSQVSLTMEHDDDDAQIDGSFHPPGVDQDVQFREDTEAHEAEGSRIHETAYDFELHNAFATEEDVGIHGDMALTAEPEQIEESGDIDESLDYEYEEEQIVPIGYGAQFRGTRVWREDESEESEEE